MIDINDYNREDLIASCLIEAAEVMSGGEVLTEGYSKDMYEEIRDDVKTIKNNMIKANALRMQSNFDDAKSLLSNTLNIVADSRVKVLKMDDLPKIKILSRLISATFGVLYVSNNSKLKKAVTGSETKPVYSINNNDIDMQVSTKQRSPKKDVAATSIIKTHIVQLLDACASDINDLLKLCEVENNKKLQTGYDVSLYNRKLISKESKKMLKKNKR